MTKVLGRLCFLFILGSSTPIGASYADQKPAHYFYGTTKPVLISIERKAEKQIPIYNWYIRSYFLRHPNAGKILGPRLHFQSLASLALPRDRRLISIDASNAAILKVYTVNSTSSRRLLLRKYDFGDARKLLENQWRIRLRKNEKLLSLQEDILWTHYQGRLCFRQLLPEDRFQRLRRMAPFRLRRNETILSIIRPDTTYARPGYITTIYRKKLFVRSIDWESSQIGEPEELMDMPEFSGSDTSCNKVLSKAKP
jgi:hypothetical protein